MRVSSLELHQKLGQTIDRARIEPVVVTKHDHDHVVILSAERYAEMELSFRRARRTGSLSEHERSAAQAARVPNKKERERYLARLQAADEKSRK